MKQDQFSNDELNFLEWHNIDYSSIYDARNKKRDEWRTESKEANCDFIYGTPCNDYGHKIRTRAGHCAQCDVRRISYQKRYHQPGYVYLAQAVGKNSIFKIGSTLNIDDREKNLNYRKYGGFSSWKIIKSFFTVESGRKEQDIHKSLNKFKISGSYYDGQYEQIANELYQVDLSMIQSIFINEI